MRRTYLLGLAGLLCALPGSVDWSSSRVSVLSFSAAQARPGHPATARSAAGVHRRVTRRAVRRAIIYCTAPGVPRGCVWR